MNKHKGAVFVNTVQLECFLAVAQYLNFSKAAESVSITQPAVSHQIGSLEDELGVKLFVRTSKSVSLTREGIMFISDAEQILKIAGSAKFRLSEKPEDEPVRLDIGCHNQAELNVLPPALGELSRLYEDLLPSIHILPFKSIDNQLKDQKIQLLLSFKSTQKQPFDYTELCRCPLMCLCTKDHPLAAAESLGIEDFSGRPLFIERHTCPEEVFSFQHKLLAQGNVEKITFCGDYESAITMAEAGIGFFVYPMIGETYRGPLKCIPINGVREVSFGVYYLRSQLEKQAKDMIRILKKIYAK